MRPVNQQAALPFATGAAPIQRRPGHRTFGAQLGSSASRRARSFALTLAPEGVPGAWGLPVRQWSVSCEFAPKFFRDLIDCSGVAKDHVLIGGSSVLNCNGSSLPSVCRVTGQVSASSLAACNSESSRHAGVSGDGDGVHIQGSRVSGAASQLGGVASMCLGSSFTSLNQKLFNRVFAVDKKFWVNPRIDRLVVYVSAIHQMGVTHDQQTVTRAIPANQGCEFHRAVNEGAAGFDVARCFDYLVAHFVPLVVSGTAPSMCINVRQEISLRKHFLYGGKNNFVGVQ